ncbi:1-phosphatidylinositol-3-phosphate 5-kinase [Phytophthora cinnamomi]|uniref:1-phosphatidylinositol-3-phosphate 5-kinase n=1 Tax=Phytophthora cinnamomi TaxID=4785 RepID=UPI00355963C4|nr:1-phosphatidylinositol-3-phosphate 5-kinase [Phytophthora cinnamomi]
MNTMSDYSFSSDMPWDMANFSYGSFSGSRNMEEELEAVLKAKQLEKEVEASQQRIRSLEAQIANQESQQDLLSTEQQVQLQEARATIKLLQEQLRLQEINARQAAYNRDSICLSKLRQTELYANEDDESEALKKKLKVLERQLKQAGISVAEVIPYEVAKKKVGEISKRLQEIGSSEVVLENKQAQAAARKEYYILEQEMEKYHMALVMTDEYIEEQRRQEQEWEDANRVDNLKALRLLRSAIPVNISKLSERDLIELVTPTGIKFPGELARRIKRTNALQLLRTDPKTIAKMHPSVIEGYRTTGLTLLERRALHVVMQEPFQEWKKQQKDDMAQKKYTWYCKLKDAFVTAATNFQNHCDSSDTHDTAHTCKLLGLACPMRAEEKIRNLYCGLGFTPDAEFIKDDILKSDPEGAGEKALLEAQAHAREMVANQRQRDLKAHYKMNMREVAQAIGALEEMDSILEHVRELDDSFPISGAGACGHLRDWEA